MGGIESALANHAFEHLFIEYLGWDRVRAVTSIEVPDHQFELAAIAQKRGFMVLLAPTHRTVLANRRLLRNVQLKLRKLYHEHILIHACETPRKQVWQWAMISDGRKVRHREHPFFSNNPPPRLLERIQGLSVSFEQEEQTTLPDVLQRVRDALMPDSELNLFAKYPWYAAKSDRLAVAMKQGDSQAFDEFVEFHIPLARHSSKMLVRWFGMDSDDAEQTAMIGLIKAAERFDPEKGFQFSTFAGFWLRQTCQRYGLDWGLTIRLPPHVFWPCYRLGFERTKLIATYGPQEAEYRFDAELNSVGVSREQWTAFSNARHIESFADLSRQEWENLEITDGSPVFHEACTDELCEEIRDALKFLPARQAEIIRLRYGIEGVEHTLQEAADKLGLTRERVRQIQVQAEEKLYRVLGKKSLFDRAPGPHNVPNSEQATPRQPDTELSESDTPVE